MKIKANLCLILLIALTILGCNRPVPGIEPTEFGFIDESGELVIPFGYEHAYSFYEGLAAVRKGGKSGFIDVDGNVVIDFQFDCAVGFSEGVASVLKGDRCGYIDKSGEFIIQPEYKGASSFVNGLAAVALEDKIGYIDRRGELVIDYLYDSYSYISEGLINVKKDKKWGYINSQGEVVIDFIFMAAEPFVDGYARVEFAGKRAAIIDKSGEIVGGLLFDYIQPGYLSHYDPYSSNKQHYIHYISNIESSKNAGNWGVQAAFKNNRALVKIAGKYGYIDKNGELVIPAIYDQAWSFSEGVAVVQIEEGDRTFCKIVDENGKELLSLESNLLIRQFVKRGMIQVYNRVNKKSGILFLDGSIKYSEKFVTFSPYHNGLYKLSDRENRFAFGDSSGKILLEHDYRVTSTFSYGRALVMKFPPLKKKSEVVN